MLFNSLHFALFFPAVVIAYFSLPVRHRRPFLLIVSYYFYGSWNPRYLLLLFFSTTVDYFSAIRMETSSDPLRRRAFFAASLAANFGMLFVFKYTNFVSDSASELLAYFGLNAQPVHYDILLPVGISFYTFQSVAYTFDVYRRTIPAERNFVTFALYVSFFPQLVAGPIERAGHLLPQLRAKHPFDYARTVSGLELMLVGFCKKLLIADRLAPLVDNVYRNPDACSSSTLLLATYFFAYQIYCDFSGYSDIARGSARILGVELMLNFDRPYSSTSVTEFWRRWHISLSTWFRDYVYVPLGGNRSGRLRHYRNLLFVFLLSGLWHGANWTFVIWGALHGTMVCLERLMNVDRTGPCNPIVRFFRQLLVFHIVLLAWVFFRSESAAQALTVLSRIFSGSGFNTAFVGSPTEMGLGVAGIVLLEVGQWLWARTGVPVRFRNAPRTVRWTCYSVLLWLIILFGRFGGQEFIYFTF